MPDFDDDMIPPRTTPVAPHHVALLFPLLSVYSTIDQGLANICCILKSERSLATQGLLQQVYPNVDALPLAADSFLTPDPERIMALHPDAVFILHAFAEPLKKVGFPNLNQIVFNPARREMDSANIWNLVGYVSTKSERANAIFDEYLASMSGFRIAVTNLHLSPVRVLPVVMTGAHTWTFGGQGFQLNDDIELAGGINPAQALTFQSNVDAEQLLNLDPQVIMLLPWGAGPSNPQNFYNDSRLQSIRAIKDRRVYLMPVFSFFNQPIDEPLILNWMSEVFHPSSMPRRTRQLYREAYRNILHYELTEDQIDQALFLKENTSSAGYDRFARSHSDY